VKWKFECGHCLNGDHESCLSDRVLVPLPGHQPQHCLVLSCSCACGPLSVSLVRLDLPPFILTEMASADLYTVGDLMEFYVPDLMKLDRFGAGMMYKVLSGLREFGVKHPHEAAAVLEMRWTRYQIKWENIIR